MTITRRRCKICGARLTQQEVDEHFDRCDEHADTEDLVVDGRMYDGDPEPLEFDQ